MNDRIRKCTEYILYIITDAQMKYSKVRSSHELLEHKQLNLKNCNSFCLQYSKV